MKDKFNEVAFKREDHSYEVIKTGQKMISVTQIIDKYKPIFDEKGYIIKAIAKRDNKTVNEIYQQWENKKNKSLIKGTYIHNFLEDLVNDKKIMLNNDVEILNYFNKASRVFINILQNLTGTLVTEVLVYNIDLGIAGQIDLLEVLPDGSLNIYDYKTNEKINFTSKYKTKMLKELNYLYDCEFTHYSLQLNTYRYLLEKAGYKVNGMFLIHIEDDKDTIHEVIRDEQSVEILIKQKDIILKHNRTINLNKLKTFNR